MEGARLVGVAPPRRQDAPTVLSRALDGFDDGQNTQVGYATALAKGERRLTGKGLRMLNEVPGIAAAFIVVLVIVKPF